jgi:hypothetical protein
VSDLEPPDSASFRQLEHLVRHLGQELAGFRRRAHNAETRVRTLEAALEQGGDLPAIERLRSLEIENAELRSRIAYATERTRQLLVRLKFLRQQANRPIPNTPATGSAAATSVSGGART